MAKCTKPKHRRDRPRPRDKNVGAQSRERSNPVALKGQRKAVNAKKARRLIGKRLAVWAGSARMSRNSGNRRVVSTESTRRAARDDARGSAALALSLGFMHATHQPEA